MSLRVDSDVKWKEFECKEYQLTEDGFCNKCSEFHSDCFCEAFWVRRSATFHQQIKKLIPAKGRAEKKLDDIENAAVCAAIAPAGEVLQNILHILFEGEHDAYKLEQ